MKTKSFSSVGSFFFLSIIVFGTVYYFDDASVYNFGGPASHIDIGKISSLIASMGMGIVFGVTYAHLRGRKADEKIGLLDLARNVLQSVEFYRACLVSPLVFLGIYNNILKETSILNSLLVAFQDGFFWQSILKSVAPKET